MHAIWSRSPWHARARDDRCPDVRVRPSFSEPRSRARHHSVSGAADLQNPSTEKRARQSHFAYRPALLSLEAWGAFGAMSRGITLRSLKKSIIPRTRVAAIPMVDLTTAVIERRRPWSPSSSAAGEADDRRRLHGERAWCAFAPASVESATDLLARVLSTKARTRASSR